MYIHDALLALKQISEHNHYCGKCKKFPDDVGYSSGHSYCQNCGEDLYDNQYVEAVQKIASEVFDTIERHMEENH